MRLPRSLAFAVHPLASRLLVPAALLTISSASLAATIEVNATSDTSVAGDGACELREAIGNANTDLDATSGDCAAGAGADLVRVPAGVCAVSTNAFGDSPTMDILSGDHSGDLTIRGADARRTVIDRVFVVYGTA